VKLVHLFGFITKKFHRVLTVQCYRVEPVKLHCLKLVDFLLSG